MHDLVVYVKEGHPFARELSLENSVDSSFCSRLTIFHSLTYFYSSFRADWDGLCDHLRDIP